MRRPAIAANILLVSIVSFLVLMVIWAGHAEIDEVTRGNGWIVPSKQIQVIQNLEGGIVSEILVRQGQRVAAGEVLFQLDTTQFDSELQTNRQLYWSLVAQAARLQAESEGRPLAFADEVVQAVPDAVAAERKLYQARLAERQSTDLMLASRLAQRRQELREATALAASTKVQADLAADEVAMLKPLVERGIEPQLELLRARQRAESLKGDRQSAQMAVQRLKSAVEEVELEIETHKRRFQAQTQEALADVRTQLGSLGKKLPAMRDRVVRTAVRAPIAGTVNRLLVTTVGGVVQPGMPLAELVPLDDALLVEAHIRPSDIAFLRPGQPARVKLTAYDYAIYGAMDGRVENIGADAVVTEDGQRLYLVHIRTVTDKLPSAQGDLPIIPGMAAEVDILSGKRTVLQYLLKPVNRIQERAFRES